VGIFALLAQSFRWRDKRSKIRRPIETKLLRAPGASLSAKLEGLYESALGWLAALVFVPFLVMLVGQKEPTTFTATVSVSAIAVCLAQLYRIAARARDYKLGLLGERIVAEELNQLMLDGCRVFHDFPAGRIGNIDHIVVAPSGVYVIETKTWRKRGKANAKDYEVTFDGRKLLFPHRVETDALDQARDLAVHLSEKLTAATAEPVEVKPILTFPGWMIKRTGRADVNVLNPSQIREAIVWPGKAPVLSAVQTQRIVSYIEEKCRDVEL
jgi:hypothetical protein